jgi:Tetratricopeptide repeat
MDLAGNEFPDYIRLSNYLSSFFLVCTLSFVICYMKKLLSILFLVGWMSHFAFAHQYFGFTPTAKSALHHVFQLRFAEADVLLANMRKNDPENLIADHIENYKDVLTVFTTDNESTLNSLDALREARLNKLRQGDPRSPYYLYTQAQLMLQWAGARFRFEQYFKAFSEASTGYKLLLENQKKFPDFMPNKMMLGFLHAVVGAIPDSYRWAAQLFSGMNGTIAQGKTEMEAVLKYAKTNDFPYLDDATGLYALVLLHLANEPNEAWKLINNNQINPADNSLGAYMAAHVAMQTGRNDEAIKVLLNRPRGENYHPFPFLDHLLGVAKLNRLDKDAGKYFEAFIKQGKGVNYIKATFQKMAWCELLKGNMIGFRAYMRNCKLRGKTVQGNDKNALKEANSGAVPDILLLRARLLFDGGYYQNAHQLLKDKTADSFKDKKYQLEYYYRFGRISHRLRKIPEAINLYQTTIELGRNEPYYFACNAALQGGLLCEEQKNFTQACIFYDTCLSLDPDDYKNSLHMQAKAGLDRIRKK